MPAVDRYGSGELNAHFVYVVNYGRMPNIRANNEVLQETMYSEDQREMILDKTFTGKVVACIDKFDRY